MKLYFLPGLGFDRRIFQRLDLRSHQLHYLDWIEPTRKESIQSYAERMAESIAFGEEEVVLIGHSMGGIVAQEIALQRPVKMVILISSIRSRKENPLHFKLMAPTGFYRLFTKGLVDKTIRFWGPQHGYGKGVEQQLIKDMVNRYSNHYLQWALRELAKWPAQPLNLSTPVVQIHGKKDKTFLSKLLKNSDHLVPEAGHFMVYHQADEISELILRALATQET